MQYGMAYFALILVCLILMNVRPMVRSRDLIFQAKSSAMLSQASLYAASLSSLNVLKPEEVRMLMELMNDGSMNRVIVTDTAAVAVYDYEKSETTAEASSYSLREEDIALALSGNDVFRSELRYGELNSQACIPVMGGSGIIGAVVLYESDAAQAAMIDSLRRSMLHISLVTSAGAILIGLLLGFLMSRRMRTILAGIRGIGVGHYETRIADDRPDELGELSGEINQLAERLQQTEAVRRRFVSDASHELKTPLAAITLLSDSIVQNDGMDRSTVREFVSDIGREAERLTRITQQLQELTRIGSKPRMLRENVEVRRVVQEAAKMLRPLAEQRNVELVSSLDTGCVISVNPDDLHQIIFNLVENAIKYNVPGGKVSFLLFRQEKKVHLIVDDTGVGVPPDQLGNIFDRFYRVDESRTGEQGGSGLGLAIVHDAVVKNGGEIRASNRRECGMRFEVTFPEV